MTLTGGRWVSVTEAVAELGLSERSVRRGIAAGKLVSAIQDGRRVIRIDTPPDAGEPLTGGRHATGGVMVELKPDTTGGAAVEALVRQAVELAERQTATLTADVRQARRQARIGWTAAAAAGLLLGVVAVWGMRIVEAERSRAAAAEAAAGIQAAALTAERDRADRLTDRLAGLVERQAAAASSRVGQRGEDGWPGVPFAAAEAP